jgi:hypothetical protein
VCWTESVSGRALDRRVELGLDGLAADGDLGGATLARRAQVRDAAIEAPQLELEALGVERRRRWRARWSRAPRARGRAQ